MNLRQQLSQFLTLAYVFSSAKAIPIVHRVLREHHNAEKQLLLTKGDNNAVDDLSLYARKQLYLNQKEDLVGTVKGYLPFIGYVTILISEN
ncbi:Signal peptidase complex catalytic subunit SEC11 [Candida viswanathii]|uniref:Signal peptidase complex catalytic subunit SEC11 n=1 Tax=Candida viswanathii TaxID=5486 RepID=A0A367YNF0_9ASCO|nr:Signal peptidase complex catalytic subunit SEC11 [Candida viswanathii]